MTNAHQFAAKKTLKSSVTDTVSELLIFQMIPYQLKVPPQETQTHVATVKNAVLTEAMMLTGTTSTTFAALRDPNSTTTTTTATQRARATTDQRAEATKSSAAKRDIAISSTETITVITHQTQRASHSEATVSNSTVKATITNTVVLHTITTAVVRDVSMKITHAAHTLETSTARPKVINATSQANVAQLDKNGAIRLTNVFQRVAHAVMMKVKKPAHGLVTINATRRRNTVAHTLMTQTTQDTKNGAQKTSHSDQDQEITAQMEDADHTDTAAMKEREKNGVKPTTTAESQRNAVTTATMSTAHSKTNALTRTTNVAHQVTNNAHMMTSGMRVLSHNTQDVLNTVANNPTNTVDSSMIADSNHHVAHVDNQSAT